MLSPLKGDGINNMIETIYKLNKSIITKSLKLDYVSPLCTATSTCLFYGALGFFLRVSAITLILFILVILLLTFIFSLIAQGMIFPVAFANRKRIQFRTPAEIALAQNHIRVDNQCWSLNDIKTLQLTPDIYPKNEKCYLTIIGNDNKKHRFFLGCGFASEEMVFENYSTFCAHVKFLFRNNTSAFKEK